MTEEFREDHGTAEQVPAETLQTGSVTQGGIHCMTVVGQIEGHTVLPSSTKTPKYEHILPQLAAVEEAPELRA